MYKFIALAAVGLVAACSSTSSSATLAAVQAALKSACGFELAAATAAQTIAAMLGIPGVTTAVDIANAICAQVNTAPPTVTASGEMVVVVKGVAVAGHRVR
jgi:hypothetical protein